MFVVSMRHTISELPAPGHSRTVPPKLPQARGGEQVCAVGGRAVGDEIGYRLADMLWG